MMEKKATHRQRRTREPLSPHARGRQCAEVDPHLERTLLSALRVDGRDWFADEELAQLLCDALDELEEERAL